MFKKFKQTYFCLFTIALLTVFGAFLFNANIKNTAFADEETDFFSVGVFNGTNFEKSIADGGTAFISLHQEVKAEFKAADSDNVSYVMPIFTFNGQNLSAAQLVELDITYSYSSNSFCLTSTNAATGLFEFNVEYWQNENAHSFTYSYYVAEETDYYATSATYAGVNANMDNVQNIDNLTSLLYDRAYYYNYNNQELPTLSFDASKINATITKIKERKIEVQTITFDGTNIVTDNNLVLFTLNGTDLDIVFNDIGTYKITYNFIYTDNNAVHNLGFDASSLYKHCDILEIFGYQLFYSDSSSNKTTEFKNIAADGTYGQERTDISYLYPQNYADPLADPFGDLTNTTDGVADKILQAVKDGTIKIQSTNQEPLIFDFNVSVFNENTSLGSDESSIMLDVGKSVIYKIASDGTYQSAAFDNKPITSAGIYAVYVVYSFNSEISNAFANNDATEFDEEGSSQILFTQWFLFEVQNNTPSANIRADINNDESVDGMVGTDYEIITSDYITNKTVYINKEQTKISMFNELTVLEISHRYNYTGEYTTTVLEDGDVFKAEKNGNYIVTLYTGKNLSSSSTTRFTVDKSTISGISITNLQNVKGSSYYTKTTAVDFITNSAVCINYDSKASGAAITAIYKYIPLVAINTDFTSAQLSTYYSFDASIPTAYQFNFKSNSSYAAIPYLAETGNVISSTSALSQAGMYFFEISDSAGNVSYFSFIIDNTEMNILQKVDGEYSNITNLNIISQDADILFGKSKVIMFNGLNLDTSTGEYFNVTDEVINKALNLLYTNNYFLNYFEKLTIYGSSNYHLKVDVDTNVLYSCGSAYFNHTLNDENNYSYHISIFNEDDSIIENQYLFYAFDKSNTKELEEYDKYSVQNYTTNYSGTHNVTVSTDASNTTLYYNTIKNGVQSKNTLKQESFYTEDVENSVKSKYYVPTTKNALNLSNQTLYLNFIPVIEDDVLEVSTVTVEFFPFSTKSITDDVNKTYTYYFKDIGTTNTIYSRKDGYNTYDFDINNGVFTYSLNQVYNAITKNYETQAGKYIITRTYDTSLAGCFDKVNETYDYITRTMTIIVDKNDIITSPTIVDSNNTSYLQSLVGDSIYLKVLEDGDTYFEDVFLAKNTTDEAILSTNKLPVYLYVPEFKYGYSLANGMAFNPEISITNINNENIYSSLNLNVEIKYSNASIGVLEQSPTAIYHSKSNQNFNGYLKYTSDGGLTLDNKFTAAGYYKVTISQGDSYYGDVNEFSFIFEIVNKAPTFNTYNSYGDILSEVNSVYKTNSKELTVEWTDNTSKFMSKIDKTTFAIQSGGISYANIAKDILQTGNTYTFKINLEEYDLYNNENSFSIYASYEGKASDYVSNYFSVTKNFVIDTQAPTAIIDKLVALSGITANTRDVADTYNITTESGLYQYFSFIVDLANIDEIGLNASIYYRMFEDGTRYNNIYQQQTNVEDFKNSSVGFTVYNSTDTAKFAEKYVEFVETDTAGNISIYTVYFTNLANKNTLNAINYLNNDEQQEIDFANFEANNEISAKGSFVLTAIETLGYDYSMIEVNGLTYLKTPYTNNKYLKVDTYAAETQLFFDLADFTLYKSSASKQIINLYLMPSYSTKNTLSVSVLNTALSIMHSTSIDAFQNQEGILIAIPNNYTETSASIFATAIDIFYYNEAQEKVALYSLNDTDDNGFLKQEDQLLESSENITFEYITVAKTKYLKLTVTNPLVDVYYQYSVADNFGSTQTITNIYGATIVENELMSQVPLVTTYENGKEYIYSTKNTVFVFNPKKDTVYISINSNTYNLSTTAGQNNFNKSSFGKVIAQVSSDLLQVTFYPLNIELANNLVGGRLDIKIEKYLYIDTDNVVPYDVINLVIYNEIPLFTLLDLDIGTNLNGLFNNSLIYGGSLSINFNKYLSSNFVADVYLALDNGTQELIKSGHTVTENGKYTLKIMYTDLLNAEVYSTEISFSISDNNKDFYQVTYTKNDITEVAKATGLPFKYTSAGLTQSITTHYILNTNEYSIVVNEQEDVTVTSLSYTLNNGFYTYFYNISNTDSDVANTRIDMTIAISVVLSSANSILANFVHYNSDGSTEAIISSSSTFVVSTDESSVTSKKLSWQSFYGIKENIVTAEIYVLSQNELVPYTPKITVSGTTNSILLTQSGVYYLTFKDLAGNIHYIDNNNNIYTIVYLSSVIFEMNGQTPIQNAMFNDCVELEIPTSSLAYYGINGKPIINVQKDGGVYEDYESNNKQQLFTFKEPGTYIVSFSAMYNTTEINEKTYTFTILSKNEIRKSYEFSGYANYYITNILKGEEDITEKLTNINMGNLTLINGKYYLKNAVFNSADIVAGNGLYTITICTGDEFNQSFTYSFTINNVIAPIKISVENGATSTDPIIISFNTMDIINSVGDSILRFGKGENDVIYITEENYNAGLLKEFYELQIQKKGEYFITHTTMSGRILLSYNVIKQDPLSTISIIVIVVAALAIVTLVIIFIRLRKKVKIK